MLRDMTVIVYGATEGAGRAVSLRLAGSGCRVIAAGCDEEGLERLRMEARRTVGLETLLVDALDPEVMRRGVAEVFRRTLGDGVDALINAVEIGTLTSAVEHDDQFLTEARSVVMATRAWLPTLRPTGQVINIVEETIGLPVSLLEASHALHEELAAWGIPVSLTAGPRRGVLADVQEALAPSEAVVPDFVSWELTTDGGLRREPTNA